MGDIEVIAQGGTDLLTAPSWDALAASAGTPFHTGSLLLSWWRDREARNPSSRLVAAEVVDGGHVIGICAFELDSGTLSFAGGRDVVDYMGPAAAAGREKEVAAALAGWIFHTAAWTRADLAGLVHGEATAQAICAEIPSRAPTARIGTYDRALRIEAAPGGYLALLNSKRRADVLRKRNRLTEAVGEQELIVSTQATVRESVERLLAWKSAAGPETSAFVATYGGFVRTMIAELAAADTGHVVELRAAGRPLASAIVLKQGNTDYLYNMAYDLEFTGEAAAGLAPGVVLVSHLVERSLGHGRRFDFLKGAQDYKVRLGGVPVDLMDITVER
jgi:CelD/BcsL family acetyltransferase involved in cellulose biosynthesis